MEEENKVESNKASIGMKILCFLIPLVGLIIFLSSKKENPEYAKGCGIAALIGVIVGFVVSIIVTILVIAVIPGIIVGTVVYTNAGDAISSTALSATETMAFNAKFLSYEGTMSGTKTKALVSIIKTNNISRYNEVSIKLNGEEVDASTAYSQIKSAETYTIEFNYDYSGKINQVIINEKSSTTNNSTNTITNSITNTTTLTNSIESSTGTFVNTIENSTEAFANSIESSAGTLTNTVENSVDTLANTLTDAAGALSNTLSSFGW